MNIRTHNVHAQLANEFLHDLHPSNQQKMKCAAAILLLAHVHVHVTTAQPALPKNVLFLPVDDLRPELFEAYNQTYMHTPNIDKLAQEGLVFQRAYCQQALCIPSRSSFMTGRRPDTTKIWAGLGVHDFRVTGPDWVSLPEHFKLNGYTALGGGKTYHPDRPPNWDEPKSWSQNRPYFPFEGSKCPTEKGLGGEVTGIDTWCPLDESKYPESYHYDWKLANATINNLRYLKSTNSPWFLAAGFRRPHVPWMMPQTYWDMYSSTDIPPVDYRQRPKNSPDIAYHNQGVFDNSNGTKYLPMPTPFATPLQQELRHAYMASVSWVDSQIGRVLKALDDLDLTSSTLVVLFGDHGYQLGEHDSWHKQTNWELATRVPLIIRAPWKPASAGKSTYGLVELVDLYRSIAELVGAAPPGDDIEGRSFAALFDKPDLDQYEAARVMDKEPVAYSQYSRCPHNMSAEWDDNECSSKSTVAYMGYSMRTPEWRYTAWMEWDVAHDKALWNKLPHATELYDHSGDPQLENDFNHYEKENIAKQHTDITKNLHQQLKDFFDK